MMFACSVCRQSLQWDPKSFTTGYATTPNGSKVCYACCAVREEESMKSTGSACLYLVRAKNSEGDRYEATNWPGTLRFKCAVKHGRHNWAGSRIDAWFRGPDGKIWHGVNIGDNEILRCRATNG